MPNPTVHLWPGKVETLALWDIVKHFWQAKSSAVNKGVLTCSLVARGITGELFPSH